MRTRAAINTVPGHPLTVEEVGVPDPKPDQVIVKLLSSGLCHSQRHQMHNRRGNHFGRAITHVREGNHAIVTWVPRTPIRGRPLQTQSGVTAARNR
jgi:Zn-dependent alcohol dehydrogenase